MKKISLIILYFLTIIIVGCGTVDQNPSANRKIFDDSGYLTEPKYKKFVVADVIPEVSGVGLDSTISISPVRLALGNLDAIHHEVFLRARLDGFLLADAWDNDSAKISLHLHLDDNYYDSAEVFLDSNFEKLAMIDASKYEVDSIPVIFDWFFETGSKSSSLEEYRSSFPDSSWNLTMINFNRGVVFDSLKSRDSLFSGVLKRVGSTREYVLELPSKMDDELKSEIKEYHEKDFYGRVHLRLAIDGDSQNIYRFSGISSENSPAISYKYFQPAADSAITDSLTVLRTAHAGWIDEQKRNTMYGDDLILHSSVRESLYFELPNDVIDSVLEATYGEKLSKNTIENNLMVLSAVVYDDNNGSIVSERNLPLPVYSYSDIDSISDDFRGKYIAEVRYKDSLDIIKNGHSNLINYTDQTLALQFSTSMRFLVNTSSTSPSPHMYLKIGSPIVRPKDYLRFNYYDNSGDFVRVNSLYNDFAAYNFGNPKDWKLRIEMTILDFFVEEGQ